MVVMRWVIAMGLIAGCGRLGFDPLAPGGGDDGVGPGGVDAAAADGATSANGYYITGGTAVQSAPVSSISMMTGPLSDTNMVLVVAIHWGNSTSSVKDVQDGFGNGFSTASGTSRFNSDQSQVIWRKDVTAGTTINVLFDAPAGSIVVKWAAYRHIDPNTTTISSNSGNGTGTTADSGPLFVIARSVLVASVGSRAAADASAGSGFAERQKANGGVLEDRVADSGVFDATATLSSPDEWIMQAVALKPLD
jgi:hypothetical protein